MATVATAGDIRFGKSKRTGSDFTASATGSIEFADSARVAALRGPGAADSWLRKLNQEPRRSRDGTDAQPFHQERVNVEPDADDRAITCRRSEEKDVPSGFLPV